jgi:hypothetical protein
MRGWSRGSLCAIITLLGPRISYIALLNVLSSYGADLLGSLILSVKTAMSGGLSHRKYTS